MIPKNFCHLRSDGVLFSVVSVCLSVCLSVNTVTPAEPLEISSRNFQGIILWSKGWTRQWIWEGDMRSGCPLTIRLG